MTVEHRVALVAAADEQRSALARYLARAGFDVHPCDELTAAGSFPMVVWLAGDSAGDAGAHARAWLQSNRARRVVIVTASPAALRDLVAGDPDRVFVLPAPTFGWDLVDALRRTPTAARRGT